MDHDHGGDAGHSHGAGEAFPRLAVRDLVGASLSGAPPRERWQTAAIALGLVLLALALPTDRLLGEGPNLVLATESGRWTSGQLLLQPLARALSLVPWMGAERAWFLIAACCWGASYPVLRGMLRGLGTSPLAASAAALLVLLSPVVHLGGSLPGPSSAALLGAAMLFRRLLASPEEAPGGHRRTLQVWVAVCLLNPSLLLLLPAVLVQLFAGRSTVTPRDRILRDTASAVVLLLGVLAIAAWQRQDGVGIRGWLAQFGLSLLGHVAVGGPNSLVWLMVLVPMLGVGVLGLIELLRRPASSSESRPPAWLWVFVGVPIGLQLVGGHPNLEASGWVLGPALALGLGSWLPRIQEKTQLALIASLLVAQVVLIVSFQFSLGMGDPNGAWKDQASQRLAPGDLLITRDQQHDYLLRHRFGLETLNLRTPRVLQGAERADWWENAGQAVRAKHRSGGRVWVDWKLNDPVGGTRGYFFQQELHELLLLAPVLYLGSDDLAAEQALEPVSPEGIQGF